jgi:hypothetical protein
VSVGSALAGGFVEFSTQLDPAVAIDFLPLFDESFVLEDLLVG